MFQRTWRLDLAPSHSFQCLREAARSGRMYKRCEDWIWHWVTHSVCWFRELVGLYRFAETVTTGIYTESLISASYSSSQVFFYICHRLSQSDLIMNHYIWCLRELVGLYSFAEIVTNLQRHSITQLIMKGQVLWDIRPRCLFKFSEVPKDWSVSVFSLKQSSVALVEYIGTNILRKSAMCCTNSQGVTFQKTWVFSENWVWMCKPRHKHKEL
jgi:hypothetical protein